jgi:hypothetical protein
MELISAKDLLDLLSSQQKTILAVWGFYSTVTLAILGFTVGSDKVVHSKTTARVIQAGYLIFAFSNMVVIALSQYELKDMAATVKGMLPATLAGLVSTPIHPFWLVAFHLVIAVAVTFAIQKKCNEGSRD